MKSWRRGARSLIRRLGYDVVRTNAGEGPAMRVMDCDIWPWVKSAGRFRTLVDIGANTGEYGAFIAGYLGIERGYAFEPQAECLPTLERNLGSLKASRIFPFAVSDRDEELEFRQTSYGPSSSALPLSRQSKEEFPEIDEVSRSRVRTVRLDDALADADVECEIFVKIDVQGYESRVIEGGARLFSAARAVMVEMSFVPMYESQPLFEEVHARLFGHGLRLAGLQNQIMSARTGQPLFAHCLYVRPAATG